VNKEIVHMFRNYVHAMSPILAMVV
jgi:hypothetical protein